MATTTTTTTKMTGVGISYALERYLEGDDGVVDRLLRAAAAVDVAKCAGRCDKLGGELEKLAEMCRRG